MEDDILLKKIDLEKLTPHLKLRDGETLDASLIQPTLFFDAVIWHFQKAKRHARLKAELELLRAETTISTRKKLAEETSERVTEGMVSDRVTRHSKVLAMEKKVRDAASLDLLGKGLIEAFRERSAMIKVHSNLTGAEQYVNRRNEGNESEINDIKNKYTEKFKKKKGSKG